MIKASSDKPVELLQFLHRMKNAVSPYSNNGIKNNLRKFGGFFKGFFATFCAALAHCQKVAAGRLSTARLPYGLQYTFFSRKYHVFRLTL